MKARLAAMEAEAAKLREVCTQSHNAFAAVDLSRHLTPNATSASSDLGIGSPAAQSPVQRPRHLCAA